MNPQQLQLWQMDAVLQAAADHPLPARPLAGWLRSIRAALGLSAATLAVRLEITASGLRKLEQAEAQDAITLATLRRVAAAMDCELQQALRLARQFQQRAIRTMTLEAQQKTT